MFLGKIIHDGLRARSHVHVSPGECVGLHASGTCKLPDFFLTKKKLLKSGAKVYHIKPHHKFKSSPSICDNGGRFEKLRLMMRYVVRIQINLLCFVEYKTGARY